MDQYGGDTPLMFASFMGYLDIVEMLLALPNVDRHVKNKVKSFFSFLQQLGLEMTIYGFYLVRMNGHL